MEVKGYELGDIETNNGQYSFKIEVAPIPEGVKVKMGLK
jgi:hypothetical protein